jgi:ubiquinone/menaquinone biosynthesis C-methylase UbiE
MSTHSAESHLHMSVEKYDQLIRTVVIHYDSLLKTGVELLKRLIHSNAKVLDLGGGTGALTQTILEACPQVSVELVDIDPKMLSEARKRLERYGNRIKIRQGSFFDPMPANDATVASLSLHHIQQLGDKETLYNSIVKSLNPGGVFLNLDVTVCHEPKLEKLIFDTWADYMGKYNITKDEAYGHFANWAQEDHYFSIYEELNTLSRAGFKRPECFWRNGPMTIYGGFSTEIS